MNVYDFDETIYDGDSTRDFYFYTLKKKKSILKYLPKQAFFFMLYVFGFITKTQFKEKFYTFFKSIKNIDEFLETFWSEHEINIKDWYIKNKKEDDIIISASPYFLLLPMCKKLGIKHLLASNVNKFTGEYDGENCYGEEKVKRLDKYTKDYSIECFYSDSYSDSPLALLAKEAFLVKGNNLYGWNDYQMSKKEKLMKHFLSKEFFAFLFIGCINTVCGVLFSMFFASIVKLNANLSFVLGYLLALFVSYLLNSALVFKEGLAIKKYLKFAVSYIPNFLIQNIFIIVFHNILNISEFLTFVMAAILGVPITFLFIKIFAFGRKK